jgi:hypothetical protein
MIMVFQGSEFLVPKQRLSKFYDHHPEEFSKTHYRVHSCVPLVHVREFVNSLKTGSKIQITTQNALSIAFLAKEFWLDTLLDECSVILTGTDPQVSWGVIALLIDRISTIDNSNSHSFAELEDRLDNCTRNVEMLVPRVFRCETDLLTLRNSLSLYITREGFMEQCCHLRSLIRDESSNKKRIENSTTAIEIRTNSNDDLNGIISYLTGKHGENLHDKGMVSISAYEAFDDRPSGPQGIL